MHRMVLDPTNIIIVFHITNSINVLLHWEYSMSRLYQLEHILASVYQYQYFVLQVTLVNPMKDKDVFVYGNTEKEKE